MSTARQRPFAGPRRPGAAAELAFREAGLPYTAQRRAVLEALSERDDHPTADELLPAVAERLPGVSRTTVYRSLETLVGLGLAARICHPGAATRYDAKTWRHHHLICERCGSVLDLESPELDRLRVPDVEARGFHVRDFSVQLVGLCAACAAGRA